MYPRSKTDQNSSAVRMRTSTPVEGLSQYMKTLMELKATEEKQVVLIVQIVIVNSRVQLGVST